jgi:hypothetical protein
MSAEARKSYGWTCILLLLGLIAFYGGAPWLLVVIPAAIVLWLSCPNGIGNTRN